MPRNRMEATRENRVMMDDLQGSRKGLNVNNELDLGHRAVFISKCRTLSEEPGRRPYQYQRNSAMRNHAGHAYIRKEASLVPWL